MQTKLGAAGEGRPPAGTVQSVKLPEGKDAAANAFTTTHQLESDPAPGTVGAMVEGGEAGSYRSPSEALVQAAPVQVPDSEPGNGDRLKLRTKDLIDELDAINAQIQRIMFQVEKAVARLATSG